MYFHPPSHTTKTIVPDSISLATLAAPAMAAPAEMPEKMPMSHSLRVHSMDSRGRTMRLRSSSSTPPCR